MHKTKERKRREESGELKELNLKPNVKALMLQDIPEGEWTKVVTQPRDYIKSSLT